MKRHTCNEVSLTLRSSKRHTCNDASQNPRSILNNSKWRLKREEAREEASCVTIRQGLARKPQTTTSVPRSSCCSYSSFFLLSPVSSSNQQIFYVCFVSSHSFTLTKHKDTTELFNGCCGVSSKVIEQKNCASQGKKTQLVKGKSKCL